MAGKQINRKTDKVRNWAENVTEGNFVGWTFFCSSVLRFQQASSSVY